MELYHGSHGEHVLAYKKILNESSMMHSVNSPEQWHYVLMYITPPF